FAGDFNMYGSGEGAWSRMYAAGNAQSADLANAPGEWDGNKDFREYHTYRTGYGLDPDANAMNSRFDFMFATDELTDGAGLDYVDKSFQVFGNDGTHDLHAHIDSNSNEVELDPDVLKALKNASDHLPIFADFEILTSEELLGDADCDGDVDAFDYVAVKRSVGRTGLAWEEGDFNGDGDVDRGDFLCLRAHFGDTVPGASGAFIPEPGALAMLALGGLVIVRRKRGRGSERKHPVRRTGVSRMRVTPRPAGR
ncbi:MAG: dockerin type I domain-containing protein, partial [Planctomycetota bacterium]